jgi:hypothetical protein
MLFFPPALRPSYRLVAIAIPTLIAVQAAHADIIQTVTVPPGETASLTASATWADTAAGQTPPSVMGTGTNTGNGPVVVNDLSNNMSATYTFARTIDNPNGSYVGFTVNPGGQGSEGIGFMDSYVFIIPTAISNATVISLNLGASLGLDDLTMRLYDYSSANGYLVNATGPVTNAQLVDPWSTSSNPTTGNPVASSTIAANSLAAGTYVLEVAGLETGTTSGTYQGSLNVEPVPLPATLPLLVGGFGLLTSLSARRRRSARS